MNEKEIIKIKEMWYEEAKPYLQSNKQKVKQLDGENTAKLRQLEKKYINKIKELQEAK